VGSRVVTRRHRHRDRDQDLALALAHIEAGFGPVEVLGVCPNPRPAGQRSPEGNRARDAAAQCALDLDGQGEGVRRSPSAVDAR
jgi:hypothetical protein